MRCQVKCTCYGVFIRKDERLWHMTAYSSVSLGRGVPLFNLLIPMRLLAISRASVGHMA